MWPIKDAPRSLESVERQRHLHPHDGRPATSQAPERKTIMIAATCPRYPRRRSVERVCQWSLQKGCGGKSAGYATPLICPDSNSPTGSGRNVVPDGFGLTRSKRTQKSPTLGVGRTGLVLMAHTSLSMPSFGPAPRVAASQSLDTIILTYEGKMKLVVSL